MIGTIFIITKSGNVLLEHQYRPDVPDIHQIRNIFMRNIEKSGDSLPHMTADGLHCYYVESRGLWWVAVSAADVGSLHAVSTLHSLLQLVEDICGRLSEEAIVANVLLLHQILAAAVDYGYVQELSKERIKSQLYCHPVQARTAGSDTSVSLIGRSTAKPQVRHDHPTTERSGRADEIFVDVIEKIEALLDEHGRPERCFVSGKVRVRSSLPAGSRVQVCFNRSIGADAPPTGFSVGCRLYDVRSHARITDSKSTSVTVSPPEGDFDLITYRVHTADTCPKLPFCLTTSRSSEGRDLLLTLRLRCLAVLGCEVATVTLTLGLPPGTSLSQKCHGAWDQRVDTRDDGVSWTVRGMPGESEASCTLRLHDLGEGHRLPGAVLRFEVSNMTSSDLRVTNVIVLPAAAVRVKANKWVRHVTLSESYVCNLPDA